MEVEGNVIYHKTEYREHRDHYAFYGVNAPAAGFDTDRDRFLGMFGNFSAPQSVMSGHTADTVAHGGAPMAGLALDVTLKPGEKKSFVFVLGYGKNPKDRKFIAPGVIRKDTAYGMMERFSCDGAYEDAFRALAAYWDDLLGVYQLSCGDGKLNRMVNIWHQYQCMVTFNMSRSASHYESGMGRGMGFRDSCQDLLGFVHIAPGRARERIIDIASVQWEDGSTYHQYQPLTKRGNNDIGRGDNAFDIYRRTCPAYQNDTGDVRRVEPYAYAQTVAGRASFDEGAGRNSWLTGTAAWSFVNISQYILGVRPVPEGLSVRPCLPEELGEYTVTRRFRGAVYRIRVKRTGVHSMTVDGRKADGFTILPVPGKTEYHVEVTV